MESTRSAVLVILVAAAMVVGLWSDVAGQAPMQSPTVRVLKDLQYYSGPGADPKLHAFDLYLPDGRKNFPMLFFVHGGAWQGGDKMYDGLDKIVRICANLGMGVMSVNYRVSPAVKHPVHIQDVARAFAWLYNNGAQYGVDRNVIFIAGGSAGAHLVALLGLDPLYLGEHGLSPKMIKGVMPFSGIHDLVDFPEPGRVPTRVERAFGTDSQVLRDASPVAHVGRLGQDTPAYLITYADDDLFYLDKHAQRLYGLFVQHRLPAELLVQPGRLHQTKTSGIASKGGAYTDDVLGPAIRRFFTSVMDGTFADGAAAAWYPRAAEGTAAGNPARTMRVLQDLQYYTGPGADSQFHSFDLYLPEGKTGFPVLFFVHGGGWRGGDKEYSGLDKIFKICLSQGMGLMSINYRVSPAIKHPVHIQDVARAFAWLHTNGAKYGVDPDRIFVAGGSAGAHLVALLGLDARYLQEHGLSPKMIKGVMAFAGIYDLANFPEPGVIPTRKEQAFGIDRAILKAASPTAYVGQLGRDTPPYLISYTENDLYSLDEQAQGFYGLFVRHRLPAELVVQPGRTHQTKTSGIASRVGGVDDVLGPAIKRFLKSVIDGSFAESAAAAWSPTTQ